MPGSCASIEQCIQKVAGPKNAHVWLTLTAHPVMDLPGQRQSPRGSPAARFTRTSLSALLTIPGSPRPIPTLDERAGLPDHPRPALFLITILTHPVRQRTKPGKEVRAPSRRGVTIRT